MSEVLHSLKTMLGRLSSSAKGGGGSARSVSGGSPTKVKKNVQFKKDERYHDKKTKMLRALVGGNPKSNRQCTKIASGKK